VSVKLRGENLSLTRGERTLFRDLSVDVIPHQALVLRGANGVGKTSLLRILAGLTRSDVGGLFVDGNPLAPLSASHRAITRYMSHANELKDDLTAEENLHDQLLIDAIESTIETRLDALNRVGLLARRHVSARKLSLGQKRRVGIAKLLLCDKPIWLLDEPTNALDDAGVALLLTTLDAHLAKGGAAVIATHLPITLKAMTSELVMTENLSVAH
jgi:heme exporter protein A